jgi:L-aspartate oxidase
MKHSTYSVVIIGSGAAGLYAAIKISQQMVLPDGILIVTKSSIDDCNSYHAQGGIVAVLPDNKNDTIDMHIQDTLKAGAGLSERHIVSSISEKSSDVIKDLDALGTKFDKDENGDFLLTLEAAHSAKRILHACGDATGKGIITALIDNAKNTEDIHIYENTIAVELMVNKDNICQGVIVFNEQTGEHEAVHTSATILATGGCGQLYKYTSNPKVATGDGIALAYMAGAEIQDAEFIQFHPTTLVLPNSCKRFLISEAVRGEGARLVLQDGTQFMYKYDDRKELAPRDIVTRAIFNEMKANNIDNVYLDATIIGKEKLHKRFPSISKRCLENGIDITKDYIPVAPAAHYSMGGIKADVEGRTSIQGLYAIGETASTGLHGANRLASNSLLECVVCASELANYLTFANLAVPNQVDKTIFNIIQKYDNQSFVHDENINDLKSEIQEIMWNNVGIIREETKLKEALNKVKKFRTKFGSNKYESREEYELRNMIITAVLIIDGAIDRKESRGGHYRSDYEFTESRAYHSIVTKEKEHLC